MKQQQHKRFVKDPLSPPVSNLFTVLISMKGRNVWVGNKHDRQSFSLDSDIVNKIDPLDENHLVLTTYKVSHNFFMKVLTLVVEILLLVYFSEW